jgi:outer membrane beta-barrel protein
LPIPCVSRELRKKLGAALFVALGVGAPLHAWAQDHEPVYDADPFHDADFVDPPLIRDVAHPIENRVSLALMFSSSLVDKYVQQTGATADLRYFFTQHWGIGASFSYFGGGFTDIVTENAGVLGNKVGTCRNNGATTCDLTLHVPDTKQVTGSFDVNLYWVPLYGKLNFVSELDTNAQLYLLAGGGVNGTREIAATYDATASKGYTLSASGGAFADAHAHANIGIGAQLFLTRWLAVRGEVRSMVWHDNVDVTNALGQAVTQSYYSWRHIGMVGLVIAP